MTKNSNNDYVEIEDIVLKKDNKYQNIEKVFLNQEDLLYNKYREIESNELPLQFKGKGKDLKNYRIYGNTVNGESVGDRTENLFDGELTDAYHLDPTTGLPVAYNYRFATLQPIAINQSEYCLTYSSTTDLRFMYSVFNNDTLIRRVVRTNGRYLRSGDVIDSTDGNKIYFAFFCGDLSHASTEMISNVMLNSGSEPLSYEPYGYRVPVTVTNGVDTQTTNIYLPEQIKMVGDEVEYVDYKEQKQHRVGASANLFDERYYYITEGDSLYYRPIYVGIGTYTLSTNCPTSNSYANIFILSGNVNSGATTIKDGVYAGQNRTVYTSDGFITIAYRIWNNVDPQNYHTMLSVGSTALPYEPYITYTELDVTLPALPTLSGTNTLSVGTGVQPSKIKIKGKVKGKIYGWHVDPDISNSSSAVTYLEDAREMIPASMGSSTFDYGSWENAFFMPKPCMLKSNGKVDYYLDPNDYTKKLDGTTSDIANPNYDGNAMMEWPKIWFKYVKGVKKGQGYFYVANYKADGNFHCWCNYDSEDNEIDHFYTAIYNGTSFANYNSSKTYVVNDFAIYNNKLYKCNTAIVTAESFDSTKWDIVSNTAPVINKMRSLSGIRLTNNNSNAQTNTTTEVTRATANNTTSAAEWYIETFSDRLLINGLLVLMGKSLNTQAVFGRGLDTGGQPAKEAYITGTLNDKGLFWGVTENGNSGVKIFGMENFWGCCWHRTAGLITNNHAVKLKLTYGTKDGSTVVGYNQTGNGYIDNGTAPYSDGYVQKMSYNKYGFMPAVVTGESQSTYYADYHYQKTNYTGSIYALFGGNSGNNFRAGAFYLGLHAAPEAAYQDVAASLSCKPLLN